MGMTYKTKDTEPRRLFVVNPHRPMWVKVPVTCLFLRPAHVVSLRATRDGGVSMTMDNSYAAYGIYTEDVPVTDVMYTLNDAGFDNEDICLMLARTHPISTIVREAAFRHTDREASEVAAGLIEWLSEFGAVVIRTFGFFIRSQTFRRALVTTREAPALCGNFETLMDLGFSQKDAWRLEDQLCEAGVLVYVACSESGRAKWARKMLQQNGARETAELELGQETRTAA
jgi:hypothetical protein